MKPLGICILALGILMIAYTGFNYITTEKVVDIGPIKVEKEKNHWVEWSPIAGIFLALGGIVMIATDKKSRG